MSVKGEVFMRETSLRIHGLKRKSLEIVSCGSSKFRGPVNGSVSNSLKISAVVGGEEGVEGEEGEKIKGTGVRESGEERSLSRKSSLLGRGAEMLISVIGNNTNNNNNRLP